MGHIYGILSHRLRKPPKAHINKYWYTCWNKWSIYTSSINDVTPAKNIDNAVSFGQQLARRHFDEDTH